MVVLLSLPLQGCRKGQDEVKIPWKVEQLAEQIDQTRKTEAYKLPAMPKEKSSLQKYWKALDYALENQHASSPSRTLTKKEAREDTTALFAMLKELYGCYAYFNQSDAFAQAEEAILQDIERIRELDYTAYRSCIRTHLRFLEDQHFLIDQTPLKRPMVTFTMQDTFEKRKDGFYFKDKRVTAIDEETKLETVLKEDALHAGSYVYYQKTNEQKTEVTLHFAKETAQRQKVLPLTAHPSDKAILEKEIQGVPYVHTARMFYAKREQEKADAFFKTAEKFKDSKAAILDLRGNSGGDLLVAESWYRSFSGTAKGGHMQTLLKLPLENPLLEEKFHAEDFAQSLSDLRKKEAWKQLDELHAVVERRSEKQIKNDTLLFVLQDDQTASAAEHLIDRLHSLDHVVFIGTPTAGMLRGSSFLTVYLKHSSLEVSFGNMLTQFSDSYAKEYYGIEPDIWTNDASALVEQLLTQ